MATDGRRDSRRIDRVVLSADVGRLGEAIKELKKRSGPTLRDRAKRVRHSLLLAIQAGVAAALAWTIAHEVLNNPEPVFAPIAAVGTIAASLGQRLQRTGELLIGVVLGIAAADLLIVLVGTGPWQLGLIVVLAIVISVFLGAGPGGLTQAAATGVLVAALSPSKADLEFPRVVDATIGGLVALLVVALLLPLNPLRVVDRAARPALEALAVELSATADALASQKPECADEALRRLGEVQEHMAGLEDALQGGRETATLAPVRWKRRATLSQYVESAQYIDHAVHNCGALVRRAVTALEDGEPIPSMLPVAVSHLAETVRHLRRELGEAVEPRDARECALRAVAEAGRAYEDGVGFSGSVVVAQVRTAASDLLRASGLERAEANRLVRKAVGGKARAAGQPSSEEHEVTPTRRNHHSARTAGSAHPG